MAILAKQLIIQQQKPNIMTFIQVLESKFYYLVEAIEHGSSDKAIIDSLVEELFEKTGYKYIL